MRRNFDPSFIFARFAIHSRSPASTLVVNDTSSSLDSGALKEHTFLHDVALGCPANNRAVCGGMISSLIAVFAMLHRVGPLGYGWRLTRRPLHGRGYHVAAAAAASSASARLKMPPIVVGDEGTKPTIDFAEYRELEELASRVVNGSAARVSAKLYAWSLHERNNVFGRPSLCWIGCWSLIRCVDA